MTCAVALAAWGARADDAPASAVCIQSAEQGQVLLNQGRLSEALRAFKACSGSACPALIAADCMRFAKRAEESMPTVVVRVRGHDGRDIVDVEVSVDGRVVTNRLAGRAVPLDPGEHALRFVIAGEKPIERTIVLAEGERLRAVDVVLPAAKPEPPSKPVKPPNEQRAPSSSGPPTTSWIFACVAVASFGGFTYFGLDALSDESDLESSCGRAGSCSDDQIDRVKRKALLADVFLGVGLASVAGAGLVWALDEDESGSVIVSPTRSGAAIVVHQTF
jgi:hypothetical protein